MAAEQFAQLVLLRGYTGVGKTTVGQALAEQNSWRLIDHDTLQHTVCSQIGDDEVICDEINRLELSLVAEVLRQGESAIVAQNFIKRSQLEPYLRLARQYRARSQVVRLQAPLSVWRKRANSSGSIQPMEISVGELIVDATKPVLEIINNIKL